MISTLLPADLSAAAFTRELIRTTLTQWGLSSAIDDVELVASELVANALRHGAAPVTFTLGATGDHVVVSVEDADATRLPAPRTAADSDTGGRGMQMIDTISRRWGCTTTDSSKTVWAELLIS